MQKRLTAFEAEVKSTVPPIKNGEIFDVEGSRRSASAKIARAEMERRSCVCDEEMPSKVSGGSRSETFAGACTFVGKAGQGDAEKSALNGKMWNDAGKRERR